MPSELALGIKDFVNGRAWEKRFGKYGLFPKMVDPNVGYESGEKLDEKGECPPDEINKAACKAVQFLRNYLLRTTNKRIWGLTFTLYPDGKFNIEYDYNKPEEYDENEDPISFGEAIAGIQATGVKVEQNDLDDKSPEREFLTAAFARLQTDTAQHGKNWGLGEETQWNLEMNAGQLILCFSDERTLVFPVQVIGTYNTKNGTFLWGWDHPSVPEPLRRAARRVREYGEREGFERFTTRTLACTENDAWEFTAAAAELDGVAGAYRGDAGGTWVYMTFDTSAVSGN
ncbi:MAG: hypothetical protein IPO00_09270 [Betaproteobacteria bacterium]|nr:hypothetical protein [Betaproteobacteria bacterium]